MSLGPYLPQRWMGWMTSTALAGLGLLRAREDWKRYQRLFGPWPDPTPDEEIDAMYTDLGGEG